MKKWTIMVFMAGDNDLEFAARSDLLEMVQVGSSDEVDIVVQFDSRRDGTIRYHVHPDRLEPTGAPLGDTNTGDPAVLTEFVRWARTTYPARHNLLVIWNHGSGWEDVPGDFNWQQIRSSSGSKILKRSMFTSTIRQAGIQMKKARAIALDATSRDFLDNEQLKQALAQAMAGEKIDVLGFDACLMGMIEIGYQLREQAHYMVASQEVEPHFGWPYDSILQALRDDPGMSPQAVSQLIVKSYGQMGVKIRARTKYTQSALDLARMDLTFNLVRQLAAYLTAAYPKEFLVRRAVDEASGQRRGAKRFYDGNSVDFYDWLWHVRQRYTGQDMEFKTLLDSLMAHLTAGPTQGLVIASVAELGSYGSGRRLARPLFFGLPDEEEKSGPDADNLHVHGVSIYLPRRKKYSDVYETLDFTQTGWGNFAKKVSETIR